MAQSPEQCYRRLAALYRDAHKIEPESPEVLLAWAHKPEIWAEHKVRYGNWSYWAAEATVRQCRSLRKRAETFAAEQGA